MVPTSYSQPDDASNLDAMLIAAVRSATWHECDLADI
jgi:hypothetical protein